MMFSFGRVLALATYLINSCCICQYLNRGIGVATLTPSSPAEAYTAGYQQQPLFLPATYTSAYLLPQSPYYQLPYTSAPLAPTVSAVPNYSVSYSPLPAASSSSPSSSVASVSSEDYSPNAVQVNGDQEDAPSETADVPARYTRVVYQPKFPVLRGRYERTVNRWITRY